MSLGFDVSAVDLFCGFGGSSQGIHRAGGEVRVAANHNQHAVNVHAANFPDTDHVVADLSDLDAPIYVDPASLPPARFMWASPSCRFHSPANAKKLYARGPGLFDEEEFDHDLYANSERSRVTMVCPLRYAAKHRPEAVVVENVVEAAKWGPDRDGSTFRWWIDEWTNLGYSHRVLFLNSMFFPPCPQSRDRMYVVFWRSGNRAPDLDYRPPAWCLECDELVDAAQVWKRRTGAWPLEQWGKWGGQYVYMCPRGHEVNPVAWPAASAIDWSNLGPLLTDRDRPLADNTIERIRRGLARFASFPVVVTDHGALIGSLQTKRTHARDRHPGEETATAVAGTNALSIATLAEAAHTGDLRRRPRHPGQMTPASTRSNNVGIATLAVAAGNTFEREGSTTRTRHPAEVVWTQHATGFVGLAHLRGTDPGQIKTSAQHIADPALTVSAGGGHHGLISGGWIKQNAGQTTAWHPYSDPFGAITSIDTTGLLIVPWIDPYNSDLSSVMAPVAAALTHLRHSLASAPPGDPDLIDLDDVRFRMLEPDPELRRVMAFADSFLLFGGKTAITAGLGNAVTPPVADWICRQVIGALDQEVAA